MPAPALSRIFFQGYQDASELIITSSECSLADGQAYLSLHSNAVSCLLVGTLHAGSSARLGKGGEGTALGTSPLHGHAMDEQRPAVLAVNLLCEVFPTPDPHRISLCEIAARFAFLKFPLWLFLAYQGTDSLRGRCPPPYQAG